MSNEITKYAAFQLKKAERHYAQSVACVTETADAAELARMAHREAKKQLEGILLHKTGLKGMLIETHDGRKMVVDRVEVMEESDVLYEDRPPGTYLIAFPLTAKGKKAKSWWWFQFEAATSMKVLGPYDGD